VPRSSRARGPRERSGFWVFEGGGLIMPTRNAKAVHVIRPAQKKARADLARALLKAITDRGLSQERAARLIGVAKSTVGRWVRLEVEMNVEAVLATTGLGDEFKRALCTEHHEPLSVGYVAKRRSSK
jgi:predicted XRE-type DNA-binding protein